MQPAFEEAARTLMQRGKTNVHIGEVDCTVQSGKSPLSCASLSRFVYLCLTQVADALFHNGVLCPLYNTQVLPAATRCAATPLLRCKLHYFCWRKTVFSSLSYTSVCVCIGVSGSERRSQDHSMVPAQPRALSSFWRHSGASFWISVAQ